MMNNEDLFDKLQDYIDWEFEIYARSFEATHEIVESDFGGWL